MRGRDLGCFVAEARDAIDRQVQLPAGYFVRFGGQFEHLERARTRLLIVVPVALVLILALLLFTYRRWQDAARVFTGVPFAAVGGIVALWLRGMPFTIDRVGHGPSRGVASALVEARRPLMLVATWSHRKMSVDSRVCAC